MMLLAESVDPLCIDSGDAVAKGAAVGHGRIRIYRRLRSGHKLAEPGLILRKTV